MDCTGLDCTSALPCLTVRVQLLLVLVLRSSNIHLGHGRSGSRHRCDAHEHNVRVPQVQDIETGSGACAYCTSTWTRGFLLVGALWANSVEAICQGEDAV